MTRFAIPRFPAKGGEAHSCLGCGEPTPMAQEFAPHTEAMAELSGVPALFEKLLVPVCDACASIIRPQNRTRESNSLTSRIVASIRKVMPGSSGAAYIDLMGEAGIFAIAACEDPKSIENPVALWIPDRLPAALPQCKCLTCDHDAARFRAMPLDGAAHIVGMLDPADDLAVYPQCGSCLQGEEGEGKGRHLLNVLRPIRMILGGESPDAEKLRQLASLHVFIRRIVPGAAVQTPAPGRGGKNPQ